MLMLCFIEREVCMFVRPSSSISACTTTDQKELLLVLLKYRKRLSWFVSLVIWISICVWTFWIGCPGFGSNGFPSFEL